MESHYRPAPGQTGTALLRAERLRARQTGNNGDDDNDGHDGNSGYIATGCAPIDEALHGGFGRGEIASVAAADPALRSALTYRLIATHLSRQAHGEALVIDAHGSFSAHALRDVMTEALGEAADEGPGRGGGGGAGGGGMQIQVPRRHEGYMYEAVTTARQATDRARARTQADDEAAGRVLAMLDRVKLTRVFDLVGIIDTVGELHAMYREQDGKDIPKSDKDNVSKGRTSEPGNESKMGGPSTVDDRSMDRNGGIGIDLIIIDDLAAVLQPILSNNHVEAQAMLASFHRTLLRLVRKYNICTVVFNTVSGLAPRRSWGYNEEREGKQGDDDASMFASVRGRPALGRSFAHLVDLSLLVSTLPQSKGDAEIAYDDTIERDSKSWKGLSLLEVLKDRTGKRLNRFALVHIEGFRVRVVNR